MGAAPPAAWDGYPPGDAARRPGEHRFRVPPHAEPRIWRRCPLHRGWWIAGDGEMHEPAEMAADFAYEGEVPSAAEIRRSRTRVAELEAVQDGR